MSVKIAGLMTLKIDTEWTNARENAGLISKIATHGSIRCQLPIEGLDVAHGLAGIPHRCPLHLN